MAQTNETIYNDMGIHAYPYDDGLEIACETEKWILKYAESPNGIDMDKVENSDERK